MGLRYELIVDDNGTPKLKQFSGALRQTAQESKFAGEAMEAARKVMEPLIAMFAVEKVFEFTKGLVEAGGEALKFGEKVGMTVEQVTGLQYAAKQSEVSTEDLQNSLVRFGKNAATAADGSGKANASFKAMGIAVTDAAGHMLPTEDLLKKVADRFHNMPDGADKARIAMDLFGKSGASMIPMLNQGSAAIDAMEKKGAALSGMTTESAEAFKTFSLAIDDAGSAIKGIAAYLLSGLAPALKEIGARLHLISDEISEQLEHAHQMQKLAEDNERAELRLQLVQVARLQTAQKLGQTLTSQQEEFLSRTGKEIAKENEKLGLSTREIELETLKAQLGAKERVNRENGAALDLTAIKARIKALQDEIALENRPKVALTHEDKEKKKSDDSAQKALEQAQQQIEGLVSQTLNAEVRLQREYEAKCAEIEKFDDGHYLRMKEQLDIWYTFKQKSLEASQTKELQQQAQQENDKLQASMASAAKEAAARLETYNKFYADQEQQEKHAAIVQAQSFRASGVDAIAVAKWREEQIVAIEDKYAVQRAQKEEAARKATFEATQKQLAQIASAISLGENIVSNLSRLDEQRTNEKYENEKAQIASTFDAKIAAAQGNTALQASLKQQEANQEKTIETQKAQAIAAVHKKYALEQKALSLAQATISGAEAIMKVMATTPPPFDIPLLALTAAATATQLALISQQHFATGGIVGGGMQSIVVNESGQEAVINHQGLRNIGSDVVAAINAGKPRQQVAQMMGSGASSTTHYNISISGVVGSRFIQDELMPALKKHARKH